MKIPIGLEMNQRFYIWIFGKRLNSSCSDLYADSWWIELNYDLMPIKCVRAPAHVCMCLFVVCDDDDVPWYVISMILSIQTNALWKSMNL